MATLIDSYRFSGGYLQALLADSPLGIWMMDEASGTTMVDSSGNGRNGTYAGATVNVAGPTSKLSKAVQFSGSGEGVVSSPLNLAGTTEVTVEFWMKVPVWGDNEVFLSFIEAAILPYRYFQAHSFTGTTVVVTASMTSGGTYRTTSFPEGTANTWEYWSIVISRATGDYTLNSIRRNGVELAKTNFNGWGGDSSTGFASAGSLVFGGNGTGGGVDLACMMAGAAIFPVRLSDARRDAHYLAGL